MTNKFNNNIIFVNDTIQEKNECVKRVLKSCDRIVFIDYSVFANDDSLSHIVKDNWDFHGIIYPCVKPDIDWDMFRTKVLSGSEEPLEQMGMHFDTELGKKHKDDFYFIKHTEPKMWCVNTKQLVKVLKKGENFSVEHMNKYISNGLRMVADTKAKLIVTYPHECVGNILGAVGVKQT